MTKLLQNPFEINGPLFTYFVIRHDHENPPWNHRIPWRVDAQDLKLDALYVVYPGLHRYALAPYVEAVPLTALLTA